MTMTPPMRRTRPMYSVSKRPMALAPIPITTKTRVKPRIKNTPLSTSRRRVCPDAKASRLEPVRYVTYAGTSGSTHGDTNDTKPAAKASGNVTCSAIARTHLTISVFPPARPTAWRYRRPAASGGRPETTCTTPAPSRRRKNRRTKTAPRGPSVVYLQPHPLFERVRAAAHVLETQPVHEQVRADDGQRRQAHQHRGDHSRIHLQPRRRAVQLDDRRVHPPPPHGGKVHQRHVGEGHDAEHRGQAPAAVAAFGRGANEQVRDVHKQQNDRRRQARLPRPPNVPHRPRPKRAGDQRQNRKHDAYFRGRYRDGVEALAAAHQVGDAEHEYDKERQVRVPRRADVEIKDALHGAQRPFLRRPDEPHVQSENDRRQRQPAQPPLQ